MAFDENARLQRIRQNYGVHDQVQSRCFLQREGIEHGLEWRSSDTTKILSWLLVPSLRPWPRRSASELEIAFCCHPHGIKRGAFAGAFDPFCMPMGFKNHGCVVGNCRVVPRSCDGSRSQGCTTSSTGLWTLRAHAT